MKASAKQPQNVANILLRVGLAGVLLYAAIDTFHEPQAWVSFVPQFTTHLIDAKTSLHMLSVVQIVVALALLLGKYVRYAAAIAAILFAGILAFNLNALYETFRDFGLLCMALALFFSER